MENKFLKIASAIFTFLAWVVTALLLLGAVFTLFGQGEPDFSRASSIVFFIGAGIYFLVLFTIAKIIKILINISTKTDKIISLLEGKSSED